MIGSDQMSKKTKKQKIKTVTKRESGQVQYSLPSTVTPVTKQLNTTPTVSKDDEVILQATKKDILITVVLAVSAITLLFILSRVI
jgi:hypothetical protein